MPAILELKGCGHRGSMAILPHENTYANKPYDIQHYDDELTLLWELILSLLSTRSLLHYK